MNVISVIITLFFGISVIGLSACNGGSNYVPVSSTNQEVSPTEIADSKTDDNSKIKSKDYSFIVAFDETESGVKTIHLKFNEAASFNAIFDTGCSGLLISMQEADRKSVV